MIDLWKKLFTRNAEPEEIMLHVAGATVRHRNPFENLEVPRNEHDLTDEFFEEWVSPFCVNGLSGQDEMTISSFANTAKRIDRAIVENLLRDFNWRSRIVGAYFAAINSYVDFEDVIGRSLLKSEVCYAGSGYCLALASFATEGAKEFLTTYLDYYLSRKDLWFDQADAFCALEYLDKDAADQRLEKWNDFVSDKPYWNLERSRWNFLDSLNAISRIRQI
jgi:Family of unknown function (DUF6000)